MDIKNNFLSIVTLGSFNPAILTPNFLKDHGISVSGEQPQGTSSPVVSEINFSNISFFAELERFQITHRGITDFKETQILDAAYKYIDLLKYTPIYTQGINFNINLLKYQDSSKLQNIFQNPLSEISRYCDKTDDFLIDVKTKIKDKKKETLFINFKYYIDEGISVSINLKRSESEINLNFNHEVENIITDRNRINILNKNYDNYVHRFSDFINQIKG